MLFQFRSFIYFLLFSPLLVSAQNSPLRDTLFPYKTIYNDSIYFAVDKEANPLNLNNINRLIGSAACPNLAPIDVYTGKIIFCILVDSQGKYVTHQQVRGEQSTLSQCIESLLPRLQFSPAIQAGKPVAMWINIPFEFCPME